MNVKCKFVLLCWHAGVIDPIRFRRLVFDVGMMMSSVFFRVVRRIWFHLRQQRLFYTIEFEGWRVRRVVASRRGRWNHAPVRKQDLKYPCPNFGSNILKYETPMASRTETELHSKVWDWRSHAEKAALFRARMLENFERFVKQTRLLCRKFYELIHLHDPLARGRRRLVAWPPSVTDERPPAQSSRKLVLLECHQS